VRDLDILLGRLREDAREIGLNEVEHNSLAPIFTSVRARRGHAGQRVADSLQSDRYRSLVEMLDQSSLRPPLAKAAALPCGVVLPAAAKAAWRRLKKAARDLRNNDPPGEFHEARKRAKRCRYTAELIAPFLGQRAVNAASKFIRLLARVQDSLGEHQDALITVSELETALAEHADDSNLVRDASALLEGERKRAHDARARFFKFWSSLDHKKLRRWMRPRSHGDTPLEDKPVAARSNGYHF
jgi:CHAD domain-containing protein